MKKTKRIKVLQFFQEERPNTNFNRDEKVISLGVQFEGGIYYQTLRLPKDFEISEEVARNGFEFFINFKQQ